MEDKIGGGLKSAFCVKFLWAGKQCGKLRILWSLERDRSTLRHTLSSGGERLCEGGERLLQGPGVLRNIKTTGRGRQSHVFERWVDTNWTREKFFLHS